MEKWKRQQVIANLIIAKCSIENSINWMRSDGNNQILEAHLMNLEEASTSLKNVKNLLKGE